MTKKIDVRDLLDMIGERMREGGMIDPQLTATEFRQDMWVITIVPAAAQVALFEDGV